MQISTDTASSPAAAAASAESAVRYVVVVHGIGDQRKNETVIQVINRLAFARREAHRGPEAVPELHGEARDILTLGRASGQTGTHGVGRFGLPWIELEGIPSDPSEEVDSASALLRYSYSGDNIRFVDLWWSDVIERDTKDVVQPVDQWAQGVVGRLQCAAAFPMWARRTIEALADTVLLARVVTKLRFKELDELVFYKFLSDVQLYGEYPRTRGRAVRRFHDVMERVHAEHRKRHGDRAARYTVIAHSLGSVLAMDALNYARADPEIRQGKRRIDGLDDLPFAGYRDDSDGAAGGSGQSEPELPDTSWINNVDAFITLGSPIDKYLTIWWFNYRYLLEPREWLDTSARAGAARIRHYNYCDEQDPVGGRLDMAWSTPAFLALYEPREDIVFNRYDLPAVAHNDYWRDQELFNALLANAIDAPPSMPNAEGGTAKLRTFLPAAYRRMVLALYTWVPLAVITIDFLALTFALSADGFHGMAIGAVIVAVASVLGAQSLELSMLWREIQDKKVSVQRAERRRCGDRYLWTSRLLRYLALTSGGAAVALYCKLWPESAAAHASRGLVVLLLGAALVVAGYVARIRLPTPYRIASTFSASGNVAKGTKIKVTAGWIANALWAAGVGTAAWLLVPRPQALPAGAESGGWLEPSLFYLTVWLITAAVVLTYRRARYRLISARLAGANEPPVDFYEYVDRVSRAKTSAVPTPEPSDDAQKVSAVAADRNE